MANVEENHQQYQQNRTSLVISKVTKFITLAYRVICITLSIASIVGLVIDWNKVCNTHLREYVLTTIIVTVFALLHTLYGYINKINSQNIDQHKLYKFLENIFNAFLFGILIWGWVVFSNIDNSCQIGANVLYKTTLTYLIVNSIFFAIPVILVILGCLCLPCLIYIAFYYLPDDENRGIDQEVLDRLYEYEYKPNGIAQSITSQDKEDHQIVIEDADDRACCICLENYEIDVRLRVLNCKHHMHKACCDEWLIMNNSCPICRQSATQVNTEPIEIV